MDARRADTELLSVLIPNRGDLFPRNHAETRDLIE